MNARTQVKREPYVPDRDQPGYREGQLSRRPLPAGSEPNNPYPRNGDRLQSGGLWDKGWNAEDRSLSEMFARQDAAREEAEAIREKRACHYGAYFDVSSKLRELGIDPYELRDYLAGLP